MNMAKRKRMTELFRRMLSGLRKKTVLIFTSLLAGALFLGGCSQDDDPGGGGELTEVAFSAAPGTRTTGGGDAWDTGDKVGIFMLTTGGSLPGDIVGAGTADAADNREYNVNPLTGALAPASGTPIYYPQSGAVDFIAYYPYTEATGAAPGEITTGYEYNISVDGQTSEAAQNQKDVLYVKTTNVAKTKTVVNLTFGHVLSKVTLNVTLGDGLTSLTGDDITAAAFFVMPLTARLDLQNGTLAVSKLGNFSALKAGTTASPTDATFTALLLPQPYGAIGRTVVFTVGGKEYTWAIPDTESFAAGNHYTYPVTVKLNGVTVGAPSITDWTPNPNAPGEAEPLPFEMVRIKAGTFLMGSSDGSASGTGSPGDPNYTAAEPTRITNETQHKVTLTKDFYMSKYEITNTQYAAFLNEAGIGNPATAEVEGATRTLAYSHNRGLQWDSDGSTWKPATNCDNHPVIMVTWYGALAFARWYDCTLPTEAQWEYACRGGKENHPFGIGTGYELNNTLANFYWGGSWSWDGISPSATRSSTGISPRVTQEVGSYVANAWGLYDMHGNVEEWCSDWYSDYFNAAVTDPTGAISGEYRVLRGGQWEYDAWSCRSAYRNVSPPDFANYYLGFRVAFVP